MKILITNYTFDASAKTVTLSDYGSIVLERVFLITNVTDNVIIYNFADPAKGGSVATNVLTLDFDTTSMDDADDLQIFYYDPTTTSGVATETTLASLLTSAQIMDDWDESDRAKVNTIVGQAGVQGGSGVVSANTQRVVLATDVALPAGNNNIGDVDVVTMPSLTIGTNANLTESLVDDAAFTPATSRVLPVGFTFDDVAPDSVNEGDIGAARMSANRNVYMTIRDAAGNERGVNINASFEMLVALSSVPTHAVTQSGTWILGANSGIDIGDVTINNASGASAVNIQDGGNSITVDGSVSISGSIDTELPAAAALADNTANPTVPAVGSFLMGYDGTNWDRVRADGGSMFIQDGGNSITVDGTIAFSNSTIAVTNAGTFVVQENGAALTSLQLIDDTVYASDAAISKVLGIGAQFDDVSPGTTTENSVRALRMSTRRELYNQIRDAAGNERGANVNASNELLVAISTLPSGTVTNAGTFVVQENGAALTSLQLIDDGVYTDDTSTHATGTSKGMGIMAVANPTDATVDANDIGMVAMTLARALKNDITTIAGTAPTTAGFIDVKGADGNIFVRQTTAANLNMTEASAASILTSVQLIDDMIYTDDTSTHATGTSKGALMMAAATPTDTAVNANDIGALAMTLNRELLVQVNTALPAGTNAIGKLSSNAGVTIGAVEIAAAQTLATVTNVATIGTSVTPGTSAAHLGKAEDAAHTTADVGVFMLTVRDNATSGQPTTAFGANGDYAPLVVDDNYRLYVQDVGNVAHDGVDAGAPVKIGFKARTTNPTAVADADRVDAMADKVGRQLVVIGQVRGLKAQQTTTITASTSETTILTAGAAGVFHDITMITIANTSATALRVDIRDATAGSVIFAIYCPAGQTTGFVAPAGDGIEQTTSANNWTAQCSASVTDVRIFIKAVKNV